MLPYQSEITSMSAIDKQRRSFKFLKVTTYKQLYMNQKHEDTHGGKLYSTLDNLIKGKLN